MCTGADVPRVTVPPGPTGPGAAAVPLPGWGQGEATRGLDRPNLSNQAGYLQTIDAQKQFRVPNLGCLNATAWKPLFIPVDSLGSQTSWFRH